MAIEDFLDENGELKQEVKDKMKPAGKYYEATVPDKNGYNISKDILCLTSGGVSWRKRRNIC